MSIKKGILALVLGFSFYALLGLNAACPDLTEFSVAESLPKPTLDKPFLIYKITDEDGDEHILVTYMNKSYLAVHQDGMLTTFANEMTKEEMKHAYKVFRKAVDWGVLESGND